jgi:oxygen-independent coproporphyrinogen-3 oxidase
MPIFTEPLPLSLYVHIPWCIRKCPYCDFNSHALKGFLPEAIYINALLNELDYYLSHHPTVLQDRPLVSIFFGGGTPSLFSGAGIKRILQGISERMAILPSTEITLEANPGTLDQARFDSFREAGINRLSLGIQSLQNDKLQQLGRIHDTQHALSAIQLAKQAGFHNLNIDLMYGLPNQSMQDAISDLETGLAYEPSHLSWYQLTIEPNTLFYRQPPTLPNDDIIWDMQLTGQALIEKLGYTQYEVSAYSLPHKFCQHNLNYWQFGDYLGIGAGAHSKITDHVHGSVTRYAEVKHPKDYLDVNKRHAQVTILSDHDLIFEFMLNALRLTDGSPSTLFQQRTGLPLTQIEQRLQEAKQRGLLLDDLTVICPTALGKRFLNNVVELFLLNS